jgi:hypothetical protein
MDLPISSHLLLKEIYPSHLFRKCVINLRKETAKRTTQSIDNLEISLKIFDIVQP